MRLIKHSLMSSSKQLLIYEEPAVHAAFLSAAPWFFFFHFTLIVFWEKKGRNHKLMRCQTLYGRECVKITPTYLVIKHLFGASCCHKQPPLSWFQAFHRKWSCRFASIQPAGSLPRSATDVGPWSQGCAGLSHQLGRNHFLLFAWGERVSTK